MQVEIWLQSYSRDTRAQRPAKGPATSKREVLEHFREGLYAKLCEHQAGDCGSHAEAAARTWMRFPDDCRPGDVFVAHKGGISRRVGFVLMRGDEGCRLQKLDLDAPVDPSLPDFVTRAVRRPKAPILAEA